MYDVLVKNGKLVTPDRIYEADIAIQDAIRDGRIAAVLNAGEEPEAAKVIDAKGNYVFPGAIDTHAHLNDPGYEWREDYEHGTAAAALGGYTTVIDMPLQNEPAMVNAEAFDFKLKKVDPNAYCDYCFWGGLIPDNFKDLKDLDEKGCVAFKSFIGPVSPDYSSLNYGQAYEAMEIIKEFDGRAPDEDVEAYITDLRDELEEAKQDEAAMLYKKEELLKEQRNIDVMQTAVDYVNEINDNRSASAVIVNPANYNDILGERMYSSNESVNFISIIIVILLFAGDYAFERQNKMTAHIRSSKGRVRLWNNKMLKVFIITTLLWLISTIINVHNISDRYVYNQLTQSIWCLQMFKDFPVNISILAYIIWCSVYRLIWMLVVAFTAYIISYRFSYKVSLMVSFVMLIPHVIYILGVNWAQKLSIVVGMDINRLFNTYGYNVKSIILLIVVFVIMLVIACATYRKNIK